MGSNIVCVVIATILALTEYQVLGDIPVNCTYEEIAGQWVFNIGEGGHEKTLNCSTFGTGSGLIILHSITWILDFSRIYLH